MIFFYHEPHEHHELLVHILSLFVLVRVRTVGHLKVTLHLLKATALLVLRYAALIIYTASPCVFLARGR